MTVFFLEDGLIKYMKFHRTVTLKAFLGLMCDLLAPPNCQAICQLCQSAKYCSELISDMCVEWFHCVVLMYVLYYHVNTALKRGKEGQTKTQAQRQMEIQRICGLRWFPLTALTNDCHYCHIGTNLFCY